MGDATIEDEGVMLLALVTLVLGMTRSAKVVCVEVIDTLKAPYAQLLEETSKGKTQALAEKAVTQHCNKKISTKDNKLCYNLEPLKKDVARRRAWKIK
ncbi:hypothetical protein V7S43_016840 [Phytophthora oleae]|uniref:Uncharacterized protein n=1 Tax=Phytophthora oleae TaxID=2107226 RepID=A0ABD3EYR7_9STRA